MPKLIEKPTRVEAAGNKPKLIDSSSKLIQLHYRLTISNKILIDGQNSATFGIG